MTEYDLGETAIVTCEIKNESGSFISPDSVVITVLAGTSTVVSETTMDNDATGKYHYDYLTANLGRHFVWIRAETTLPARITIKPDSFEVIPSY